MGLRYVRADLDSFTTVHDMNRLIFKRCAMATSSERNDRSSAREEAGRDIRKGENGLSKLRH